MNRSGSTFLANLFSKSPEICVCPEADILVELFLENAYKTCSVKKSAEITDILSKNSKFLSWNLSKPDLKPLLTQQTNLSCFKEILECYRKKTKPFSTVIVFKAERLIHLFQKLDKDDTIKWLSIIRDPRGIYNSQNKTTYPGSEELMSDNPILTALSWKLFIKKSQCYTDEKKFFHIRFEDLISNAELQLDLLTKKLELEKFEIQNTKGELWNNLSPEYQLIHENIQSPPLNSIVSKWKKELSDSDIFEIQLAAGKELRMINYEMQAAKLNIRILILHFFNYVYFKIHLTIRKITFRFKHNKLKKDYES